MSKIYGPKMMCKQCGDVIFSKHVHDFVTCSCGALSVDGGAEYLRIAWKQSTPNMKLKDIAETMTVKSLPFCAKFDGGACPEFGEVSEKFCFDCGGYVYENKTKPK